MNDYDLRGRVVIVTGGAGGIGRAIARLALASGARISLWDHDKDGLRETASELTAASADGERHATRHVDVTDEASIAAALAADQQEFGRIDAFVNNAGILGEIVPLWETDPARFRRVIEVNLIGAYLCLRAVLDVMRRQEPRPLRGHIVNIASIQGKEGMPRAGAYSASKAALIALTKTAGKETAALGIMVNCITPAAAETAMARELSTERRAEILGRIPLGRFVDVDEIARMVAFLCTDDCSFSTGAVFDLSGGRATY
jgi:NAD(P)-dependent dehydrogenase (short-subunit alcohol dehydrogenase family)